MNGGAGPLYGAAELERQDAQDETQQRDDQPYRAHQFEAKGVLEEETRQVLGRLIVVIRSSFTALH